MKLFLKQCHRWLGVPIGLLFILIFGTGLLTAIDELRSRNFLPSSVTHTHGSDLYTSLNLDNYLSSNDRALQQKGQQQKGQQLTLIAANHTGIRQIIMPTRAVPYFQVQLPEENVFYSASVEGQEITIIKREKHNQAGFFDTVLQLHRNLLLGKENLLFIAGNQLVAWASLLGLAISFLGICLWWPMRQSCTIKKLVPLNRKRHAFYYAHLTSGIVCVAFILLMALTGASITYPVITKIILGSTPNIHSPLNAPTEPLAKNWHAWSVAAASVMPEGQLARIQFPRTNSAPSERLSRVKENNLGAVNSNRTSESANALRLVFLHPQDWFGIANSYVVIDAAESRIINHSLFMNLSFTEKIMSVLKPLHTGKGLPTVYVMVLLLFSGLGVIMVLSGLVSFAMKKRRSIKVIGVSAADKNRFVQIK